MSLNVSQYETRTLHHYALLLKKQRGLIICTLALSCLLALPITVLTPPRYRAHCRLQFAPVSGSPPSGALDALFTPLPADTGSQAEMLLDPALLATIARKNKVSLATLRLQVRPVPGTELLEMTCEASAPGGASRFLDQWAQAFTDRLRTERAEEAERAASLLRQSLKSAQAEKHRMDRQLSSAPLSDGLEKAGLLGEQALDSETVRLGAEALESQKQERTATAALRRQQARLFALEAALQRQPSARVIQERQPNPRRAAVQEALAKLETEQARLNILLTPEHSELQQLHAEIAHLQAEENRLLPLLESEITTANPLHERLETELLDARTRLKEAQADMVSAQGTRRVLDMQWLQATRKSEQRALVQQERERWQPIVNALTGDLDTVTLRATAFANPLRIVVPAGQAEQIAPNPLMNLLYAALLGLPLGLCLAFLREPMLGDSPLGENSVASSTLQGEGHRLDREVKEATCREAEIQAVVLGRETHFVSNQVKAGQGVAETSEGSGGRRFPEEGSV